MSMKIYTKIFTLTASAEVSATITVDKGFNWDITELYHVKTGACDVTALKVGDVDVVADDATNIDNVMSGVTRRVPLAAPIRVGSQQRIVIKLKDTSAGANTVKVAVHGIRVNVGG